MLLIGFGVPDASAKHHQSSGAQAALASVITPMLVMLTIFFTLLGLSNAGIGNFGVVALMSGYGTSFSTANLALTAYFAASAVGVLAGGFFADRTRRHGQLSAVCYAINTVIVIAIATVALPTIPLIAALTSAGFLGGLIAPSRDMMVRNATPAHAAGRAFGIVSTGFNFSGIASPLLFGWIMDQSLPHWVFGTSAIFMILTVGLAVFTDRSPPEEEEETLGRMPP
jgi:MFS family permease